MVKKFDVIVIGAGSGLNISDAAASMGKKVAVVEEGPMGGTCLNRGCIPSKIVIHSASLLEEIKRASKFGINVKNNNVNFAAITGRASRIVDGDAKNIEYGIRHDKNHTLYKMRGKFIGQKLLQVGKEKITADKIFIAAGTRSLIPAIKGLDKVKYLTSTEALRLKKLPKNLIIIGGGYIAAELAHFFGALGSKITIIQRNIRLIPNVDEEVADKFTKIFSKKFKVVLNKEVTEVSKKNGKIMVYARDMVTNKIDSYPGDELLLAVGRIPNTDILDVKAGGIELNEKGYVRVNEFLETNVPGVWAIGDIAGVYQFKHSANLESQYAYINAFSKHKLPVDYRAMPYAIFSNPEVAGVGKTEQELRDKKIAYAVGKYEYIHTGMGTAILDEEGFVKFLVEKGTGKILGCHILGTQASTLIHEVVIAMRTGDGSINAIKEAIHVHPALSEVVQRAANSVEY